MASGRSTAPQPTTSTSPTSRASLRRCAAPDCTDPNLHTRRAQPAVVSPVRGHEALPGAQGFDEFYGYGRLERASGRRGGRATARSRRRPRSRRRTGTTQIDPAQATIDVRGHVDARGEDATPARCYVAPGVEPEQRRAPPTRPPAATSSVVSAAAGLLRRRDRAHGARAGRLLGSITDRCAEGALPGAAADFTGNEHGGHAADVERPPEHRALRRSRSRSSWRRRQAGELRGEDRRNLYLHRDQDMLAGLPEAAARPTAPPRRVFADLDGDNRNELIFATSDGVVHALRRDGTELPGWPVHGDPLPLHTGEPAFTSGRRADAPTAARSSRSVAVGDLDRDGIARGRRRRHRGQASTPGTPTAARFWTREANSASRASRCTPFVNVRHGERYRTAARLHRLAGDRRPRRRRRQPEIVAAGMDRHVYAWHADGSPVSGFPVLVVDRSKIAVDRPADRTRRRSTPTPARAATRARSSTRPRSATSTATASPRSSSGPTRSTRRAERRRPQRRRTSTRRRSRCSAAGGAAAARQLAASTRSSAPATPAATLGGRARSCPAGPRRSGSSTPSCCPVVGEGITGSPGDRRRDCPSGGAGAKVGVDPATPGPATSSTRTARPATAQTERPATTRCRPTSRPAPGSTTRPRFPAVGHAGVRRPRRRRSRRSSRRPPGCCARSTSRVNEYQGGQDFIAAWDAAPASSGPASRRRSERPRSSSPGPSVADIDGLPGRGGRRRHALARPPGVQRGRARRPHARGRS